MQHLTVKESESLELSCSYKNDDGTAITLENIRVESCIQGVGSEILRPFEVTITNEDEGEFTLTMVTNSLKARKYLVDILFIDTVANTRLASDTFELNIEKAITKGV